MHYSPDCPEGSEFSDYNFISESIVAKMLPVNHCGLDFSVQERVNHLNYVHRRDYGRRKKTAFKIQVEKGTKQHLSVGY